MFVLVLERHEFTWAIETNILFIEYYVLMAVYLLSLSSDFLAFVLNCATIFLFPRVVHQL